MQSNNYRLWQPYCIIVIAKSLFFFFIKTSDHKGLRKAQKQTKYTKLLLLIPECTIERCITNIWLV